MIRTILLIIFTAFMSWQSVRAIEMLGEMNAKLEVHDALNSDAEQLIARWENGK